VRRKLVAILTAGIAVAALASQALAAELSAAQIVEKNVAARGGLDAWRKIDTMIWSGHVTSAHGEVPSMLFVMQLKRPNKTRFDINALGKKTVRIFDGERGWKVKPSRDGGPEVTPYSTEEVAFAQAGQAIDGPLIDYLAKGNTVTLEGRDEIRGRKAYRLGVRLAAGESDHVWIDAQTFLDLRYDRHYSSAMGPATVSVFYGNYKTVQGLQIPSLIETTTAPGVTPDKLVIENIMPNAPVNERSFARPGSHERRAGMPMGGQGQPPVRRAPIDTSAAPAASSPDPAAGPK
jgi:outer membrane lipoprotein-sorting protein